LRPAKEKKLIVLLGNKSIVDILNYGDHKVGHWKKKYRDRDGEWLAPSEFGRVAALIIRNR
jgi:hypothetical protein